MSEPSPAQIVLHSTGAIGDTVIATALIPALQAVGFHTGHLCSTSTLPLWQNLCHAHAYITEDDVPPHAIVVNIRDYQFLHPHTARPFKHLCQYMRLQLIQGLAEQGHRFALPEVSRDEVKLSLTVEEYLWALQKVKEISQAHSDKPVIMLAPCAHSANRSLDPLIVAEIGKKLQKFSVPVLLDPLPPSYHHLDIERFATNDLRKGAALLALVDGFVSVDSGPLHLAAAARQGMSQDVKETLQINNSLQNIILLVGSSHPAVVGYHGVKVIRAGGGCPLAPCGMHGYDAQEMRREEFARPIFNHLKEASGCIYSEYPHMLTAQCIHSIPVDQVINAAKHAIAERHTSH